MLSGHAPFSAIRRRQHHSCCSLGTESGFSYVWGTTQRRVGGLCAAWSHDYRL